MSKKKWRDRAAALASAAGLVPAAAPAPAPPVAAAGDLAPEERVIVDIIEEQIEKMDPRDADQFIDETIAATQRAPVERCRRAIVFADSIEWRCACGATGLSVRTPDGLPYHDEESMAHAPAEPRRREE